MRPILLEMSAFGPYAELQVIDFTILEDVNMFLIHGATGGGKTTILDAICYALYGDTSGNERDAESMRSHFAKEDTMTEVKLTFKLKEDQYFVHRIPAQERPKKTGTGFTIQNPVAELYKIKGNEKELLASGVNKAREKIIEIIGFDADQFRQVIMIPQGQFRKLLVAESEERQKILGEIFQTRKYKKVEEKLREEEKKLRDEAVATKERQAEQIKNIKYRDGTLLEELIVKENIDVLQIINELKVTCQEKEQELQQLQENIVKSKKQMEEVSKDITTAVSNKQKYDEKVKVQKQYQELVSKEELYIKKEKEYKLALSALPLYSMEQYIATLFNQKQKIQNDITIGQERLGKLEDRYNKVIIQKSECKDEEKKISELEIQLYQASEEYRPKVTSLVNMKDKENKVKEQINVLQYQEKNLKDNKAYIEKDILESEEKLSNRQKLNDNLREYELQETRLLQILDQRKKLVEFEERYNTLRLKYKQVDAEKKIFEASYAKASQEHNELLQQRINGQAWVLAQTLKQDKPCPVCGSTTHPSPAESSANIPSEVLINEKKLELDNAHKLYLEAENKRVRIETEGKACAEQVKNQKQALGEYAELTLDELNKTYNTALLQKIDTEKELLVLKKLDEQVQNRKKEKIELEQKLTNIQHEISTQTQNLLVASSNIEQIEKEIPKSLQNIKALEDYISYNQKILKEMKDRQDKVNKELESISALKIELQTLQNEKLLQLRETTVQYETKTEEFKEKIKNVGFEDLNEYKRAYKSEEQLKNLDEKIKNYNKERNILEARFNQLEKETKDIVLANIEDLESQYRELEIKVDSLSRQHQSMVDEKSHNERQIKIIQNSENKIKEIEKRYAIVGDLYKAARGNNIRGLSFERFIQSALFEDILIRANERLQLMSNNRYELYRSDNRKTMASQSGLEMEVLDTYTGKRRHVRTLSGGEGFMASLSLALGLADVVQSYAGGISLDTIFIDEGFGTLDSEALDSAIKTLIDLQKSGRLVGIISHVPELKERIGARIEVVTSQRGSKAMFYR